MDACSLETGWLKWIECHPSLAGYIQAVGTILAVLVAFFAPRISAYFERRARESERRSETKKFIRSRIPEAKEIGLRVANVRNALLDNQKQPPGDRNNRTDWFNTDAFLKPPNAMEYSYQWDSGLLEEKIKPFSRLADAIRDYNNVRASLAYSTNTNPDSWSAGIETLLGKLDHVDRSVSQIADQFKGRGQ